VPKIVVVTVTYGNRWHLLRQAVGSARDDGASLAVIVDNAASSNIEELSAAEFGPFAHVVRNSKNLGSAGGFKRGLQTALDLGADFVLLLDDDNQIQPGCLRTLCERFREWEPRVGVSDLALLAYRPDHQADVAAGLSARRLIPGASTFFGFSIIDVPFKIWRRTSPGKKALSSGGYREHYVLQSAPYSGMFLARQALLKHDLPNEKLILYADDTEFSYRLTAAGGKIILVTDARIVDLDQSWNVKSNFSSSFDIWLIGSSESRVYYAARNHAYWELHCRKGNGAARTWNRAIFICILWARAQRLQRMARYRLLRNAIADGEACRLGEHPPYIL
jgi:GT2 family glycosyltransferase